MLPGSPSAAARGRNRIATSAIMLALTLLAGTRSTGNAAATVGRRFLARRGYCGFLAAPAAGLYYASPSVVVRAASATGTPQAAAATAEQLVNRRGGASASAAGGGGVFGSLTRLFSSSGSGGGDAIRTEAPAVKALEAAGAGAGEGFKGDLLVLPVFQPEEGDGVVALAEQPVLAAWDAALDGAIAELVQTKEFKGKAGSAARVRLGGKAVKALTLVGLGKKSAFKSARALGPATAADIKAEKPKTVAIVLPAGAGEDALVAVAEDLLSGLYVDNRFKTGDGVEKPPQVDAVAFYGVEAGAGAAAALKQARAFAEGVRLTKDLVGAPANFVTPRYLAETATRIAKEYPGWEIKVLGQAECEARKMGAYLAVAQGSKDGPEFIHLSYKPKSGPAKPKKLVLIGKGLTFDSGGYNLKAGAGSMIELMKFDMGGAGAVLGAAKALAELEPAGVEVHVIVAACENMISDKAYRPGDILTASNGKTIEVLNTDAEGRLTLADALVYAEALEPDFIVDSATLTGACIIALGGDYGGLWSGSDELAGALEAAAKAKGEKLWRMPLAEEYKPNIKSEIADLKNVGGREGGSITAALFLAEFVKKTPWAHLDIAGPVWNPKKGGATGFGARTLAQWVLSQQQQ